MLQYTDKARAWVASVIAKQGGTDWIVRLEVTGRGPSGYQYDMALVDATELQPDDVIVDHGDFKTAVAARSVDSLRGATVDLVEHLGQSNLKIDNPNPLWPDPIARAVQAVLDDEINPNVAGHGGSVQLLDVQNGIVYVQMSGGCHGCGMSKVTLRQGIEKAIRRAVPGIVSVLDTTDHAAGKNPYYSAGGTSPFA